MFILCSEMHIWNNPSVILEFFMHIIKMRATSHVPYSIQLADLLYIYHVQTRTHQSANVKSFEATADVDHLDGLSAPYVWLN